MSEKCSWCNQEFEPWRYSVGVCRDCVDEMRDKLHYLKDYEQSAEYVMRRYPLLVAHMICESLGYFTPKCAAIALIRYRDGEAFFCEWYSSCVPRDKWFDQEAIKEVGRSVIKGAFANRKNHKGYMSSLESAKACIQRELAGCGPILASWF